MNLSGPLYATVLGCRAALDYLSEDCHGDSYQLATQKKLTSDVEVANLLWDILSADETIMKDVRTLTNIGSSQISSLCMSDELTVSDVQNFLLAKTKGLEIWQTPELPNYGELLDLASKTDKWWTLERSAAFFRLYFEFHKYFARLYMAKKIPVIESSVSSLQPEKKEEGKEDEEENTLALTLSLDEQNSVGSGGGGPELSLRDYFITSYEKSENYRKVWLNNSLVNPYDKSLYKLRRLSPKGLPKSVKKILRYKKNGALTQYSLEDNSVTAKMNRIYGLPNGSDISGTFINNAWVIKTLSRPGCGLFGNLNCYTPGGVYEDLEDFKPSHLNYINMLLLTALVGQYHHTFNEVALIFGLKDLAPYQVGRYATILKNGDSWGYEYLYRKLKRALNKKKFQHQAAFFAKNSGGEVCGYTFQDVPDYSKIGEDRFLRVNAGNYHHLFSLPNTFLSESELKNFLEEICQSNSPVNHDEGGTIDSSYQKPESFFSIIEGLFKSCIHPIAR